MDTTTRPQHQTARCVALLLAWPLLVQAGQQTCNGIVVSNDLRRCSDGGIPVYSSEPIAKPAPPATPAPRPALAAAAGLNYFFGVWRTSIPGAVWASPSGYPGQSWLHVSAGLAVGDLIIKPDGSYLWNSYGGKKGRWEHGDAEYPLVLIDTMERRRWKVGVDPKRTGGRDIVIWDGNAYYYDGRR